MFCTSWSVQVPGRSQRPIFPMSILIMTGPNQSYRMDIDNTPARLIIGIEVAGQFDNNVTDFDNKSFSFDNKLEEIDNKEENILDGPARFVKNRDKPHFFT
jgi:hypothetical protein